MSVCLFGHTLYATILVIQISKSIYKLYLCMARKLKTKIRTKMMFFSFCLLNSENQLVCISHLNSHFVGLSEWTKTSITNYDQNCSSREGTIQINNIFLFGYFQLPCYLVTLLGHVHPLLDIALCQLFPFRWVCSQGKPVAFESGT